MKTQSAIFLNCVTGAGTAGNMVIPTLPIIGVVPHFEFFQTMNWIAIALAYTLLTAAFLSTLVVIRPLAIAILYCIKPSSKTPQQCGLGSCRRCMNSLFFIMGRWLCVQTFPVLFKIHKTRSDPNKSQTRKFMVFLDRKVESSVQLIAAFCSIICCIFFTSAAVFFQYFPAEESTECLEIDSHRRSLFCYINSSLPVDCANFSVTELRELKFQCYAIALPVGLGIAVAAAFGLAEVGIVGVTIFVKVTEGFFNKIKRRLPVNHSPTTNSPQNQPHRCGCCKLSHANEICIYSSIVLIIIVFITSSSCAIYTLINLPEADRMQPLHILYYFAYLFLPMLICIPLIYIVKNLEVHCSRGEYISIGADQWPPNPRDWDVESKASVTKGEQDEAGTAGENNIIISEPPDPCELDVESGASSNAAQLGIANMRSGSIHGEEGDTAH